MSKRTAGERAVTVIVGGVFRRADGGLVGKWRASDEPSSATRQHRLRSTDEVAARAELEAYAAKRIGLLVDRSSGAGSGTPRTLGELAERHFAALRAARARSVKFHASRWSNHGEPHLSSIPLAAVTHGVLLDWVLKLRASHSRADPARALAPRTIRSAFATVSLLLSTAVAHGWIATNATRGVRRWLPADVGVERSDRVRALSLEQARALLSSESIPLEWWIVYAVAIFGGLREGEIRGVRWLDVVLPDEDDAASDVVPAITVRASFASETKTGRVRVVPVHPELVGPLRWWRRHGWLSLVGRPPAPTDLVFPARSSRMHGGSGHPRALAHHLRALSLPVCSFHGLRHTSASLYRGAGVAPDDIAQILGHRFPGMVHHYARPTLHYVAGQIAKLRVCTGCARKGLDIGSADAASCTRSEADPLTLPAREYSPMTTRKKSTARKSSVISRCSTTRTTEHAKNTAKTTGAETAPAPAAPTPPIEPPTELGGIAFSSFSPAFREGFVAGTNPGRYSRSNPHEISTDASREWGDGWLAASRRERTLREVEGSIEIPRDYDSEHADGDLESRWRVRCETLPRELRALIVLVPSDDAPVVVPMHHKEASLLFAFMRSTSSVRALLVHPGGNHVDHAPEAL